MYLTPDKCKRYLKQCEFGGVPVFTNVVHSRINRSACLSHALSLFAPLAELDRKGDHLMCTPMCTRFAPDALPDAYPDAYTDAVITFT